MIRSVNRKLLDPYINALMNKCRFSFAISYINDLERKLRSIKNVYISDNIDNNTVMYYSIVENAIYINPLVIERDEKNNDILDYNNASLYFRHTMFHELLHAASTRSDGCGIIPKGDASYKSSLNEGITQMLTDELCGYYENKFLGSYNLEKIIASIISQSVGKEVILNSYFKNPNILESEINKISRKYYYSFLNIELTKYSNSKDKTKEKREDALIRSVVLNIIIPTYRRLDDKKREKYLSKLLYSISGDEVIKNKLIHYINTYINLDEPNIKKQNDLINNQIESYDRESNLMADLTRLDSFIIRDDGSIFMLGINQKEITSREHKEKIYRRLFELNGYKKYLTPEVKKQYIDSILKGKSLKINYDSVLKKRMMFCGIKELLEENGLLVLNDYEELDKVNQIKVRFIHKKISFEDYKKVCENLSVCKTRINKNEYSYSIIFNSTKNEVEDDDLKRLAYFSYDWLTSIQDKGRDGIDEAFHPKHRLEFNELINKLCIINGNLNSFNLNVVEKIFKNKTLIRKLMSDPVRVEWLWGYIVYISKMRPIKPTKGLSYEETIYPNYIQNRSIEEAQDIMRKKS